MSGLKSYIIAVCSAAILCGILRQIVGKSKVGGGAVRLLSGLFIAICILSPWKGISLDALAKYNPLSANSGEMYVETGKEWTQAQIDSIIIEKTQAYILEKAKQLGMQVEVKVELSEEGVPFRSVISGVFSLENREELSAFLVKELGIQKEMQIWI